MVGYDCSNFLVFIPSSDYDVVMLYGLVSVCVCMCLLVLLLLFSYLLFVKIYKP